MEQRILSLQDERNTLTEENYDLKVENKKLKQTKQIEEEMIAHKLKMREEQVSLDADKRVAKAEQVAAKKSTDDIAAVKDTYRDKLENQLEKRGDELKSMYKQVLTRLPDISMAITKDIKQKD